MLPRSTIFAGMSRDQLQAALTTAQQAYIELATGAKGVSFSYSQGDGTRSVTYQPTDVAQLNQLILQLQSALGLSAGRRAIRVRY